VLADRLALAEESLAGAEGRLAAAEAAGDDAEVEYYRARVAEWGGHVARLRGGGS
jgi:hypothetical protein